VDDDVKQQQQPLLPPKVEDMMLPKLRQLFESAHAHGKDQLAVRLETTVVAQGILSMTCFPFLSREDAIDNPALLERYYKAFHPPTGGPSVVYDLLESRVNREDGDMKTTIEVQVWLLCKERFQVRDVNTGLVVQGTADYQERLVTHILRMERTVRHNLGDDHSDFIPELGDWRIADIDDLVHHKTWYHL
jgi:hypothetical protein